MVSVRCKIFNFLFLTYLNGQLGGEKLSYYYYLVIEFILYEQAKQKQKGAERLVLPSVEGQEEGKWVVIDSGLCCSS